MGIRRYIFEYIQNLDQVLTNLKRAEIIISGIKFQFFGAGIKILGYICHVNTCHYNTFKVLKV